MIGAVAFRPKISSGPDPAVERGTEACDDHFAAYPTLVESWMTLRILLVEDEPLIGLSIQDALEEAGYSVRLLHTGQEAILDLHSDEAQSVGLITDVRLVGGGPDGWDIAREARELDKQFPVVYISGDSASEHGARGVPDSVMIQKPFAPAQVVTAISALLNALPARTSDSP
jgi:DNA-binding response OmpR family regulator